MTTGQVEALLFNTMEGEVIRLLMSGNDTQCFTTAQFEDAKERWIEKMVGCTRASLGMEKPPPEIARKQLQCTPMVVEVSPNVWTLRELEAAIGATNDHP